jgi:hypothetical protein
MHSACTFTLTSLNRTACTVSVGVSDSNAPLQAMKATGLKPKHGDALIRRKRSRISRTIYVEARDDLPAALCTQIGPEAVNPTALGAYMRKLACAETQARAEVARSNAQIHATMRHAARLVPIQLLIVHGMFGFAQQKCLWSVFQLLQRLQKRVLLSTMIHWRSAAQAATRQLRARSVSVLQRAYRACSARAKLQSLRLQRIVALEKEQRRSELRAHALQGVALFMQKHVRGAKGRQELRARDLSCASAKRLQRWTRSRDERQRKWDCLHTLVLRVRAARRIQRLWRGVQGRKRAIATRVAQRKAQAKLRLGLEGGPYTVFFEHHGAALRLQRWWQTLDAHKQAVSRLRERKCGKSLHGRAANIQRCWRGRRARKRVQEMKAALARQGAPSARLQSDEELGKVLSARMVDTWSALALPPGLAQPTLTALSSTLPAPSTAFSRIAKALRLSNQWAARLGLLHVRVCLKKRAEQVAKSANQRTSCSRRAFQQIRWLHMHALTSRVRVDVANGGQGEGRPRVLRCTPTCTVWTT